MGVVGVPLLVLGFLLGAVVYGLLAWAAVGALRTAAIGVLRLYWEWRTHREEAQQRTRLADVQRLPAPSGGRQRSRAA